MSQSAWGGALEAIAWPVPWGSGQPEATILSWGLGVFLIHPAPGTSQWGLLHFARPKGVRYGSPNLEIADAHPLGEKAEPGVLYLVHDSPWLGEVEKMNVVHPQYDAVHWRQVRHYFAFLWDYTFECLATNVTGELLEMDFHSVVARAAAQIAFVR